MKIYILSSNKYAHVCSTTIAMLNKYWPDQDITLVGYEDILKLKDLPDDVEVVSLGNQDDFPSWSDALVPFFQKIPEDYFTLLFEDHILMNKVPLDKLEEIEEQFRLNTVQKAMIGGGNTLKFSTKFRDTNLLLLAQGIDYRASLHPAIWKKQYLLKYLKPNMSSWDFEIHNNHEAAFDGAYIVNYDDGFPENPIVYSYLELFNKGIIAINEKAQVLSDQPSSKFFNIEDIKYVWNTIHDCQKDIQ